MPNHPVFSNNAGTTLAAALSNSATSATLVSVAPFPSISDSEQFFPLTLISAADSSKSEITYVTNVTGNTVTLLRGQEGTTPLAFNAGDHAQLLPTAGVMAMLAPTYEPTLTGPVTITSPSSQALVVDGSANAGGASVLLTGNGNTTPRKLVRVVNGALQVLNSALSAVIASVSDLGDVVLAGALQVGTVLSVSGVATFASTATFGGKVTTPNIAATQGVVGGVSMGANNLSAPGQITGTSVSTTAGSSMGNGFTVPNGISYASYDTGGSYRPLLQADGSNYTLVFGGTAGFRVRNSANSRNNLLVDDSGNLTLPGQASVGSVSSGGQIVATAGNITANTGAVVAQAGVTANGGNIVASNGVVIGQNGVTAPTGTIAALAGRVRAAIGAFGSGDPSAAVILGDFISGPGWLVFPDGHQVCWGFAQGPSAPDGTSPFVTFGRAFSGVQSITLTAANNAGIATSSWLLDTRNDGFFFSCSQGNVSSYYFAIGQG